MSLHLSKCHIVGNHMSQLIWLLVGFHPATRSVQVHLLIILAKGSGRRKKIYTSVGPFVQWSRTIYAHLVVLRHHEEQFCELFFFNLDQWFRRSCLKIFLI